MRQVMLQLHFTLQSDPALKDCLKPGVVKTHSYNRSVPAKRNTFQETDIWKCVRVMERQIMSFKLPWRKQTARLTKNKN
jgi:hypothetical protein